MRAIHLLALAACTPLLLANQGCDDGKPAPTNNKNTQAERARQAAESIQFTDNAEIENIKRRLELTSKPGLQGFIILLNNAGQPILYEGVKGKVTSGSKRLTDPRSIHKFGNGNGGVAPAVTDSPSDEGTFGSSGDYVFYWNQNGQYRQWNGFYLYSDKPFRLNVEPLAVSIDQSPSKP